MTQVVALLRGINLARTNRIGMADLRALLSERGFPDVRTLLQSGNVVVGADRPPEAVAREMEAAIEERFGFAVDVIARTGEELAQVVAADPLGDVATDGSKHFVVFLSEAPDPTALEALLAREFAPDVLRASGRELYVWCPDGMRDSALMKALGKHAPGPVATVRNWNTVTKLLAMVRTAG